MGAVHARVRTFVWKENVTGRGGVECTGLVRVTSVDRHGCCGRDDYLQVTQISLRREQVVT